MAPLTGAQGSRLEVAPCEGSTPASRRDIEPAPHSTSGANASSETMKDQEFRQHHRHRHRAHNADSRPGGRRISII
ncbi:hypothetical protein SCLCIDRAFT_1217906 [Scleroderma citrinum Foug A]|uniref:Uncharacterized protein n=1 Tax=Scleroderma citrinum Foug A TaxID=1036808 RepID=A0A0C2ZBX8_9AGAM|nr:hypothetical protein SCLCIDRAFT_1217906 [Scleroderma citrinum Foug A]